ncbi:MAG TPA: alpha-2-macroglobulin [Tepidanaerobacter syntrophicus]|uniref:Ig-like domain-containing protein n=1 Tax=Tepidanaerobacter syntrophicus TaxID=224999 RepID=UPI00177061A5|nr:Ig-like domain-containing alpha-2-macroglobulin family protein [Tepidanaerobacter syntrophicus]HHV82263.1 alpha-2-macroglobulin [Tepidanaerobacter syntrophicus]
MKKSKHYAAIFVALIILLVLGLSLYINMRPSNIALASEITMKPTDEDSAGAAVDTKFVLSANSALDPKFIRENLSVEPALDFTVSRDFKDNKKVIISPTQPLEPQKIYKFILSSGDTSTPFMWAFQTKGDFKVISTLPANQATGVPQNTGIEITFSHVNFENLPQFFSITPAVEGSFEIHKKTAVFVPKGLEPETLYTVTIKKGLPLSGSSQTLKEDYTFQFETLEKSQDDQRTELTFFRPVSEFSSSENPVFQFGYYGLNKNSLPKSIDFTVYKYKTADDYINALSKRQEIPFWAYLSRQNYREDISGLESAAKFSLPVRNFDDTTFVEFPDVMPPGYYIAQAVTKEGKTYQVWFEVTDLAVYAAVDKEQTLVWVNDLTSGKPVSKANVRIWQQKASSTTDDTGLAKISGLDSSFTQVYPIVSKDGKEAVAAIYPGYRFYFDQDLDDSAKSYWKYLYLDRPLYKPDSTVNFWGLVKPRESGAKPINDITVSLISSQVENAIPIETKNISLDGFSYTGSFKLPNLIPGYYFLEVKHGSNVLSSKGFEVATYDKPAYQLEISSSKKAVYVGDKVDFEVKAAFFEGTPVPNTSLEYYIHDYSRGNVVTNNEGSATISFSPEFKQEYGFLQYAILFLTAKLPEAGDISAEAPLFVLNNDIKISAAGDIKNRIGKIQVSVDRLTVDKVNSGTSDPWDENSYISGPAANHPLKVRVFREVWEKYESGTYYDFINKKVQPRYEYEYSKVLESEIETTTGKDGKALLDIPVKSENSYIIEITAVDFRGNPAVCEYGISGSGKPKYYGYTWYYMDGKDSYKVNENVELSMKQNEAPLSSRPKGFLFITSRDGIKESYIKDDPKFQSVFKEEFIPNFWVKGVYFDGRYYHEASDFLVRYDSKEKELDIGIETDKSEYKPGDTVNAVIEVKDKNGKPIKALVNVNLVDEALYALRQEYTDILYSIYSDFYDSGIRMTGYTHESPDGSMGSGAEGGGEGGSERRDFKDAVLFKTVGTDKNGKAKFSFSVPDNLTSWRLTCQAVTEDIFAGTKTAPIVVKLPFFVTAVTNDTYLTGDKPVIPIRAFGTKIKSGMPVSYEITLKGLNSAISRKLSGSAFTSTGFSLPALEKGNYELAIAAKTSGDLADKLILNFNVLDSLLTKQQVDFWLMSEDLKISGAENTLTTLTFSDYERSQYLNMLFKLRWVDGSRIDQQLAAIKAQKLLKEYFNDLDLGIAAGSKEDINLLKYQTEEGGIALLPYSSADLELSTKLAALCGNEFDKAALANYFYKIAEDPTESRERSMIALCGLSALNEPVLTELKIFSSQKDLTAKEQLYLSLAFLEIGDKPSASTCIKEVLTKYGENLQTQMRIKYGTDQDDILEATSLASAICAGLNMPEQNKLEAYVAENLPKDELFYIEELMFLENALPNLPKNQASFEYVLEGKTEKVTLEPGKTFSLLVAPEKLAGLKFKNIRGKVGITAVYPKSFDASAASSLDGVKISRSYQSSEGKAKTSFKAGDLIKVSISYEFGKTAPDGPYLLTDLLPAGLKMVEMPFYRGAGDKYTQYPILIDGQKVMFVVYEKKNWTLNYYARIVNPGEFKAEPAIIQHMTSGIVYGASSEYRMSIK